jgi:hypothetical protein
MQYTPPPVGWHTAPGMAAQSAFCVQGGGERAPDTAHTGTLLPVGGQLHTYAGGHVGWPVVNGHDPVEPPPSVDVAPSEPSAAPVPASPPSPPAVEPIPESAGAVAGAESSELHAGQVSAAAESSRPTRSGVR